MPNELRFIHAADLHLGRPFRSRDAQTAHTLSDALLRSFDNLIAAAVDHRVSFLILAGDVFDVPDPTAISPRIRLRFRHGLERLIRENIPVFISPGNHDPCTAASIWRTGLLPDNPGVRIFDSMKPETVELESPATPFPIVIHGVGHTQKVVGANLTARVHAAEDGRFHVAVVHAFVQTAGNVVETDDPEKGRYAPCAVADFRGRGIHYWALGHIHQAQNFIDDPALPLYAGYSGCIQGLDPSETGPKGAFLVRVAKEDDRFHISRELLALHEIEWVQLQVDASGVAGIEDVTERIRAAIEPIMPERVRTALRLRVRGAVNAPAELAAPTHRGTIENDIREDLGLAWLDIQWELTPARDPLELEKLDNVLGRLLQALRSVEGPEQENTAKLREVLREVRAELKAAPPDDDKALDYLRSLLPEVRDEALTRLDRVE